MPLCVVALKLSQQALPNHAAVPEIQDTVPSKGRAKIMGHHDNALALLVHIRKGIQHRQTICGI